MTYSTKNMGKRILLQDWSLKQRPKHGITQSCPKKSRHNLKNGHTCVKVAFKPCFLQVWPGKPRFWPFLLPYLQGIGPTRVVGTGLAIFSAGCNRKSTGRPRGCRKWRHRPPGSRGYGCWRQGRPGRRDVSGRLHR